MKKLVIPALAIALFGVSLTAGDTAKGEKKDCAACCKDGKDCKDAKAKESKSAKPQPSKA